MCHLRKVSSVHHTWRERRLELASLLTGELSNLHAVAPLDVSFQAISLERLAAFVHVELARALDHRCGARVL